MTISFVLINCELGKEKSIIEELLNLEAVKEANGTMGSYDILVKLDSSTVEDIRKAVAKIRQIDHISSTLTLTVNE